MDYNDSSSDEDNDEGVAATSPQVYSIHSSSSESSGSSSSSDDSSEAMLDYDEMWDKHMASKRRQEQQQQQRQEESGLATQPPAPPLAKTKARTNNNGTPVPKTVSTKRTIVETPESLAMSSISGLDSDKKPAKAKPPKVSLSPQKKDASPKLKPGSKVTMLEAVVTEALNTKQEKKATVDKKPKKETAKSETTKPPSDTNKKDTVNSKKEKKESKSTDKKVKKDLVKKDSSTSKPKPSSAKKKERAKKDSTVAKAKSSSEPNKKKAKKESSTTSTKPSSSKKAPIKTSGMATTTSSSAKPSDATQKPTTAAKRKSPPESSAPSNNSNKDQPPKKKKKKRTFQEEILFKMLLSCKPFTLKTLAQSIDSTEAAIHHVMLSLVDKNIVIRKEFTSKGGRTKELYWANQESTAKQVLSLELPSMEEMTTVQEEYASLKAKDALFVRELALVNQEPSNEELDKKLTEMQQAVDQAKNKIQETKQRIAAARGSGGGAPNARMLKKRINHMRDEWKKRKTKTMDFVDQLADGMEKPIKEVVKLLDLETDEMDGVTMPPKHDIS